MVRLHSSLGPVLGLLAALALGALPFAGCSSESDDDGSGGSSSTSSTSGTGGDGGQGASSGSGGGGGSGGGAGGSGGSTQAGTQMHVVPSSRVVLEEDDGGGLTVECRVLEDGLPYAGTYSPTVTLAPTSGYTEDAGSYAFAEFGVWSVTCAAEVDGQTVASTIDVGVLNEAIDPRLAAIGEGISGTQRALIDIMAADGGADQLLIDAMGGLDVTLTDVGNLDLSDMTDVLREIPGGYPTPAELTAQGIATNADDTSLPARLTALETALGDLKATIDGLDPSSVTAGDLQAVEGHTAALQTAVDDLLALQPTAHGYLATRTQLADVVRNTLLPTVSSIGSYADGVVRAEASNLFPNVNAQQDGPTPYFGFLSLTLGMFNSNNLQITMINKVYGKYIAELDKSINNLILVDLIDYFFPPNPQGPVIEFLQASASLSFAVPGYPTWIDGHSFNDDPQYNLIIVIGDGWQTVVDNIFSACGINDANTIPEAVDILDQCVQDVFDAVNESTMTPTSVVTPGLFGSQQGLDMGNFPQACSGSLPVAIALIPINLGIGRGPAYTTNCLP